MIVSGTMKASYILYSFLAADGQDSDKSGLTNYTGICKNCAVPSFSDRKKSSAKTSGLLVRPELRRVTLTNSTAGPLAQIFQLSRPENG